MGKPIEILFSQWLKSKNIARIIVQSQRLKNKILSLAYNAKVEQIPFGIPEEFLSLRVKQPSTEKVLLYFGHAYSVRGIDDMLVSINSLLKEGLNNIKIKFVITPETNIKFLEKTLSQFPQLPKNTLIIKRYVNNLGEHIRNSDLAFFLYRFSGEIPEYPLALIETMAAGVPIITTNIGAIGELFPENIASYCLVSPGDIKGITSKTKNLLFNSIIRNSVIQTNRNTTKQMTWSKYYDRLKESILN